jgi:hypothetical protein
VEGRWKEWEAEVEGKGNDGGKTRMRIK